MEEQQFYDNQSILNPQNTSPYSSPMYNMGSSIILLTNPNDDLYELELKLKGLAENDKGDLVKIGDRLVNDIGINEILSCARSLISQVTTMSNLQQRDIDIHRDYLGDTLAKLLMINRIRYQMIYPESTRDLIFDSIIQKCVIIMKRALEEGERRFWKGSQQEITMRNETKQGSGGGGLSKVMGWLK